MHCSDSCCISSRASSYYLCAQLSITHEQRARDESSAVLYVIGFRSMRMRIDKEALGRGRPPVVACHYATCRQTL